MSAWRNRICRVMRSRARKVSRGDSMANPGMMICQCVKRVYVRAVIVAGSLGCQGERCQMAVGGHTKAHALKHCFRGRE